MTRLLPLLLAALLVAGCGSSATDAVTPAAPAVAAAKPKKVRTLPKKVFVHRVDSICRGVDMAVVYDMPTVTGDVARNRRVFGAYFGRTHSEVRRLRRKLVRLGQPSRDRARWRRALAKVKAMESHIDTLRAAAWSGSVNMLVLSARELRHTSASATRRFERFGAKRC